MEAKIKKKLLLDVRVLIISIIALIAGLKCLEISNSLAGVPVFAALFGGMLPVLGGTGLLYILFSWIFYDRL